MDSHFRGDPQARCRHACRATRSLFSRGEYKLERAGPQSEKSCRLSWRHQGDECPPGTGPALGARGAWPRPATVGGRAPVAAQHARGRCPGGVRLADELGPKPDGGDGEGGGGGRAARLEHVGEVGGEPGVVNLGLTSSTGVFRVPSGTTSQWQRSFCTFPNGRRTFRSEA